MSESKYEIEKDFISLLLHHKDLVEKWYESNMGLGYFEDQHRIILQAIKAAYVENKVLTKRYFQNFLKKNVQSKQEISSYEHMFNRLNILSPNADDFDVLKEEIIESYVQSKAVTAISKFKEKLKNKEESIFATKALVSDLSELTDISINHEVVTTYESLRDFADIYVEDLRERIEEGEDVDLMETGIKEVDECISVGLVPGQLTLFCADVGGLKSTILLNIGLNVWREGYNVLFIPLEMPRQKMYEKVLSRESSILFDRLIKPSLLTDLEIEKVEKVNSELKAEGDSFYIMDKPDGASVNDIKHEIQKHIDVFKPDLVIVDYAANLKTDRSMEDKNTAHQIGMMLQGLQTMGRPGFMHKEGFHVISAAQIGRDALKRVRRQGVDKMGFNSEDIRGSHEYSAVAANIFAQMKDPAQPNSRLILFPLKSRYGPTSFKNGDNYASLATKPEVSLVESIDDSWYADKSDDILSKVDDDIVEDDEFDFDLDIDDIEEDLNDGSDDLELDEILEGGDGGKSQDNSPDDDFSDLDSMDLSGGVENEL